MPCGFGRATTSGSRTAAPTHSHSSRATATRAPTWSTSSISTARATARIRPDVVRRTALVTAPARVQASGGIRSVADAERLLEAGAARVVVGTAAFADEDALGRFVRTLGERLVVAVDVRDGRIAVGGWTETTTITPDEAAERCRSAGVSPDPVHRDRP